MRPRQGSGKDRILLLFCFMALTGSPWPAVAGEGASSTETDTARESESLKYRGILGASLLAGAIVSASLPGEIFETPPSCRWCGGADPNAVDRWARQAKWEDTCRAGRLSYATAGAAGAMALLPMSHESNRREWLQNAGAVVDSVAVTFMVTQAVKYTVRRERPGPDTCYPDRETDPDRNLSFLSGHASLAFALVSSAHETARLRGRRTHDAWLWAGGASAALTGYLRVAADRHHLTDVLAGAGIGYAVGKWVPRQVLRPRRTVPAEMPDPEGGSRPPVALGPPLLSYSRPLSGGGRSLLVQVGKGPGRSLQIGVRF